jgi:ketosteroid isomerase-like protein
MSTTVDAELDKIRTVVLSTYAAWNSRDTDNANPYFEEAPEDMFFDYWPLRFEDWKTYKNGAQRYLDTLDVQKIIEKKMCVQRLGNVAWASATYDVDPVSKKGEKFHVEDGRHTSILQKKNDGWKVRHEHWSPRAPQQPLATYPGTSGVPTIKAIREEGAILAVTSDIFKGWNSLDIDSRVSHYRQGPEDSFFHLFSGKLTKFKDFTRELRDFFAQHKSLTLQPSDTRVFREGDVAWVGVTWDLRAVQKDGRSVARKGRYTGVLVSFEDGWKVVHEHWSEPVRAAGWENYE